MHAMAGSDVRAWLVGDLDDRQDIRLMRDGTQIPHRDLALR
jgi:hypothetical protein